MNLRFSLKFLMILVAIFAITFFAIIHFFRYDTNQQFQILDSERVHLNWSKSVYSPKSNVEIAISTDQNQLKKSIELDGFSPSNFELVDTSVIDGVRFVEFYARAGGFGVFVKLQTGDFLIGQYYGLADSKFSVVSQTKDFPVNNLPLLLAPKE